MDEMCHVRSRSELQQATVEIAHQHTNGDASLLAFEEANEYTKRATSPPEVDVSDDLLSPVSIPGLVASGGKSCIIDDRSDVRSATQTNRGAGTVAVEFPSIMVVPFERDGFLFVGSRETASFANDDLDRLQVISAFASRVAEDLGTESDTSVSDERVTEAASFLSHDAKNLVSVINGRLELAKDAPEEAEFDAIQNNLDRLAELIDGATTLLRTGDHLAETEPTSLEEVVALASDSVDDDRSVVYTESLAPIVADRSRLCQLFENLFRNAVDHAGTDVTIWVGSLENHDGFFVEDDGSGIDPADRDALFELGYSTGDDHSGIGLTIVEWIAEAHGWDVDVTSSVMGGARFEFRGVEFAEDPTTPE